MLYGYVISSSFYMVVNNKRNTAMSAGHMTSHDHANIPYNISLIKTWRGFTSCSFPHVNNSLVLAKYRMLMCMWLNTAGIVRWFRNASLTHRIHKIYTQHSYSQYLMCKLLQREQRFKTEENLNKIMDQSGGLYKENFVIEIVQYLILILFLSLLQIIQFMKR